MDIICLELCVLRRHEFKFRILTTLTKNLDGRFNRTSYAVCIVATNITGAYFYLTCHCHYRNSSMMAIGAYDKVYPCLQELRAAPFMYASRDNYRIYSPIVGCDVFYHNQECPT